MGTQLNALPALPVRARTVSGCLNSAFLNISQHFTVHLFRPWIPNSARHRRWTPMIQRGRARRTISAGSWFGQWSPDPPSSATAALPAPNRWRVTWRPPLSRMAGPGDPRPTCPRPSARHLETSGRPNGGVGRPLADHSVVAVRRSPGSVQRARPPFLRGREQRNRSQSGRVDKAHQNMDSGCPPREIAVPNEPIPMGPTT